MPDVMADGHGQMREYARYYVCDSPSRGNLLHSAVVNTQGGIRRPNGGSEATHHRHVFRYVQTDEMAQALVCAGALMVEAVGVIVRNASVVEVGCLFHHRNVWLRK